MNSANPYAPPADATPAFGPAGATAGIRREGDRLVVPKGAVLPARCVKCNAAAEHSEHKKLTWAPPWVFIIFVLSWLIGLIVYLVVRKTGDVTYSLCPEHLGKRRNGRFAMLGGVALLFGGIFAGIAVNEPLVMLLGLVGGLVAIIVGAVMAAMAQPTKIDPTHIWLKVGDPFLNTF